MTRRRVRLVLERLEDRTVPAVWPNQLALSSLNGLDGFSLHGGTNSDAAGRAVSGAGDVNGDGLADLIVGAGYADAGGTDRGRSYVVFGRSNGFAADRNLELLNGSQGLIINGEADGDSAGFALAGAGDVNGDGLADLIIGAPGANIGGSNRGRAYVVFGRTTGGVIDLSAVAAGSGGFVLNGEANGDQAGKAVAGAGDVNGDGLADLMVGAPYASAGGLVRGRAYVIFGRTATTAIDLSAVAAGTGGFVLNGEADVDFAGFAVAGAGDVNGDSLADLIVGAVLADAGGSDRGRAYVVFGRTATTAIDLSAVTAGTGGFTLNGEANSDYAGAAVAGAGDVNGDGLADLIVAAFRADAGGTDRGRAYVVFGRTATTAINLSAVVAGIGGFALNGEANSDLTGAVAGAGDINGDDLADLLIGAPGANAGGIVRGRAYVVFGRTASTAIDLSAVAAGSGGFALNGEANSDHAGSGVAGAGDINGDGMADLVVGAPYADAGGTDRGRAYVVLGRIDLLAVGPDKGGAPLVNVYQAQAHKLRFSFFAYPDTFTGGVRVAVADVNGDGQSDVIVAPGAGVVGRIKVFDGRFGTELTNFPLLPYGPGYTQGIYIAAADFNGDRKAEIVVGAQAGPRKVKVLELDGSKLPGFTPFLPYGSSYTGGVRVAAGDVLTGGAAEIITARSTGASQVLVFDSTGVQQRSFKAFTGLGGNFVAAGDVDGDGVVEVIVAPEGAQPGLVRWYDVNPGNPTTPKGTLAPPYGPTFHGGVRIGVLSRYDDLDRVDILTVPGKGLPAEVKRFDALTMSQLDSFFAYAEEFTSGAFVAGS